MELSSNLPSCVVYAKEKLLDISLQYIIELFKISTKIDNFCAVQILTDTGLHSSVATPPQLP